MELPDTHSSEIIHLSAGLEPKQLADSVALYLEDSAENGILRDHQLETFKDLELFFRNGHHRGYIDLPTGTGKTVLFVELAKALLSRGENDVEPKILVVTPTKDLVHQTIGRSGEKGFGGFASELNVNSFFSDSKREEREEFTRSDVGITTYQSFELLKTQPDFIPSSEMGALAVGDIFHTHYKGQLSLFEQRKQYGIASSQAPAEQASHRSQRFMDKTFRGVYKGEPMLDKFNIIFLDEAHHALPGSVISELVKNLPEDIYVIGFTATPDANEMRQLQSVLSEKIHSMSLMEAIDDQLLSPITPIAIKSGVRIDGSNIYSDSGEYIDSHISYLASSKKRNDVILNTSEVFARNGVGTIISCIAGGGAAHARGLAEQLNARGVSAAAVYSEVSAEDRQAIYESFEKGEIDVLTFIGVLGEGWDSKRAKAIINARPTRSQIFAKQRVGRIARPGGLAYTVDIYDEHENINPPITVADLLTLDGVAKGTTFGKISDMNGAHIDTILTELNMIPDVNILEKIPSAYALLQEKIASIPKMEKGSVVVDGKRFLTSRSLSTAYTNFQEDMIVQAAKIQGIELEVGYATHNGVVHPVFEQRAGLEVLRNIPVVDPNKYFVDEAQERWTSSIGLALLFGNKYPGVTALNIESALASTVESTEWMPGRVQSPRARSMYYRSIKMYHVTASLVGVINSGLLDLYQQDSD